MTSNHLLDLCRRAYAGTSMTPTERGERTYRSFVDERLGIRAKLEGYGTDPGAIEAFLDADEKRFTRMMAAESRCVSTFIAGPSNFPARRMQKYNDRVDKARSEWLAWRQFRMERFARDAMKREGKGPISSDDSRALALLREKADKLEAQADEMVARNKIVKRKTGTREEKEAELLARGVNHPAALFEKDFAGRIGYADYEMTNARSEVRRLRGRIAQLEKRDATPPREWTFADGRAYEREDTNRLHVYTPSRPAQTTIDALKRHGFHWSPNDHDWRRMRGANAAYALREVAQVAGWVLVETGDEKQALMDLEAFAEAVDLPDDEPPTSETVGGWVLPQIEADTTAEEEVGLSPRSEWGGWSGG